MQQFEINAEPRSGLGKGASRRLRRAGKLPGVIYGAKQDTLAITLDHNELNHQLENEAFYSHILSVKIGGEEVKAVLKDLHRHPYKPSIMHVDFLRISETEKITMRVPLHFINEAQCIGVKQGGGVISHILTEVEISCLPKDLPEYIEVDMADVKLNEAVHLGDIRLPAGVEIYALTHGGDPARPVASVHIQKVIEEEVAAVPAEGVEGIEAAAAAEAGAGEEAKPAEPAAKEKDKGKDKKD
jgi:large subunit ribosomal protein L25